MSRQSRVLAGIIGSGNIGTDLLMKLLRSDRIELRYFVGIDPASEGLRRATELGVEASAGGVEWLLARDELPELVFDATSAHAHIAHANLLSAKQIQVVDLTPAALGPFVVPVVNLNSHMQAASLNMVTCGGQATIPIVAAVTRVCSVPYAEIIASIASRSAGPGTRANIDEFTETTARGLERVGGAARGKAIIILNPADPPLIMRDTVFCAIPNNADWESIADSIQAMVAAVAAYVPGYRLTAEPQFDPPRPEWSDNGRVAVFLEIEGRGDFLPPYAGNLDIMTAAAARVGEQLANTRLAMQP